MKRLIRPQFVQPMGPSKREEKLLKSRREVHLIGGGYLARDEADPTSRNLSLALCGRQNCTTLVGTNHKNWVTCGECLDVEDRERLPVPESDPSEELVREAVLAERKLWMKENKRRGSR